MSAFIEVCKACHVVSSLPYGVARGVFSIARNTIQVVEEAMWNDQTGHLLRIGTMAGVWYYGVHLYKTRKTVWTKEKVIDLRHPQGVDYVSLNRGQLWRVAGSAGLVAFATLSVIGGIANKPWEHKS